MSFLMSLLKFLFYGKIALRPISYVMKMLQKCLQAKMSRQRRRSKSTQNPCQPSREAPSPCQSLISCCSDSSTANSPRIRLSHSSFATPLLSPVHSRLILCPKQSCTQSKSEARLSSTQDPVLWEPLLGAADGLVLETLPGVLGLACPVSEGDPGLPTTSPFP